MLDPPGRVGVDPNGGIEKVLRGCLLLIPGTGCSLPHFLCGSLPTLPVWSPDTGPRVWVLGVQANAPSTSSDSS